MKDLIANKIDSFRNWAAGVPAIQRFQEQHPTVTGFVADRFNTNHFVGLPLTLILLAAGINLMLLSELTESILDAEWIVIADKKFTELLYSMRSEWLSNVFYGLTQLGEREAVFIFGAFLTLIFLIRKRYWAIVAYWVAMGGVGLTVRFAKRFISRARPEDVAYYQVEHFSFPSGHATTAMALFGMLAYFLYRHEGSRPYRPVILWGAIVLILLVSFSRVYLGVHFLSDVMAGMLVGLLWTMVGISIEEVMLHRNNYKRRLAHDKEV